MKNKESGLIKIICSCQKLLRKSRILRYSCRFSKKTYTQHQHILLLVLKTHLKRTYREAVEIIGEMHRIRKWINLRRIPHFTTLQKFMKKFNPALLERLIYSMIGSSECIRVAVDSTGFSSGYASTYYVKRGKGNDDEVRSFMKASIAIDLERQLVLSLKVRKAPANYCRDFIPLLKGINPLLVIADKGYDTERNLRYLRSRNIQAAIPVRTGHNSPRRTKLRKRMKKWFERNPVADDIYHERSKVESVFSSVKRRFGEVLYSRSTMLMKKELKLRFLVYNVCRQSIFYFILWRFSTEPPIRTECSPL
jgi:hypothetical protein